MAQDTTPHIPGLAEVWALSRLRAMTFLRLVCLLAGFSSLAFAFEEADALRLKSELSRSITKGEAPGAVFWVDQAGKETHWAQGHKVVVPTSEAMTEDTIFDAASLTKVMATLPSILLLMEQGKVDLSAPIGRYLPEAPPTNITVKHLLTHCSGLPAGIPKEPAWSGYEEGIHRACALIPGASPDCVFRYSDVNFILLGEIVRRVSGQSLDVFAHEQVFGPLGMKDTGFTPEATLLPRIAPTEKDELRGMLRGVVHDPTARRMGGVAGHAGLFTTAADVAKYCKAMLRGGLLKPETMQQMRAVQTPITIFERRGLGFDLDSKFSRPRGKPGFALGSFGHTGFTGTALWIDPQTDSFYVLMTSRLHPEGKGGVRDLYERMGTLVSKAVKAKPEQPAFFPRIEGEVPTVLNGIDVLKRQKFASLQGLRLGLITNHTGIDNRRVPTIDLLAEAPGVKLKKLFSPEHGIRGELDQEKIDDSIDTKTGLPVISLYGETRVPKPEHLADLDALVFDIQDIGCRFYTYIATLKGCLEAAAKAGKAFIVLDRVNPIRGDIVEGMSEVGELKFTACHPIPVRHGMTAGELAQMFNTEGALKAKLSVIKVQGWQRDQWLDETGLPWQNPSPNMRNGNAALLYPGVGLLEFAISVGRGTDTPFEVLGAPFVNDRTLAYELNELGLPGVRFVPVQFKPTASVFKDQACGGVRMIITDRHALRPVSLGLAVAHRLHELHPKEVDMNKLSTLINHPATMEVIQADKPWATTAEAWQASAEAFMARRTPFLLYE